MNKLILFSLLSLFSFFFAVGQEDSVVDSSKVVKAYIFDIKEEIAPPVWRTTQKALKEAKSVGADFVIIHMNTYGGTLNDADSIRTAILQYEKPVYVFIDNNAASAGALISIACDSIYMRSGANIGAATVVNQKGEVVPDKYQSYMRSLMRSTAEANGRDPQIAQAMVDPRIKIDGVIDSAMVLTFTSSEAIANGFCEGTAESVNDVVEKCGGENVQIIRQKHSALDHIIGFLINPMISGLLIMLIVGGIYFELQSPGLGFPIVAALVGAFLYFAPLYLEGVAANWEIIIFVIGVILIAVEVFAIPGFGVAGVAGLILMIFGLTLGMVNNFNFTIQTFPWNEIAEALLLVTVSILLGVIFSFFLAKRLFGSHTIFGTLALDAVQESKDGYTVANDSYSSMIGKTGEAVTTLRPAGKIIVEGEYFDACAEISYISKGEKIIVKSYQNGQLFVMQFDGR